MGGSDALSIRADIDGLTDTSSASSRMALMSAALPEAEGAREGRVGEGERLALLIVGDSSAVGVGVPTQEHALARHLAATLAVVASARRCASSGSTPAGR